MSTLDLPTVAGVASTVIFAGGTVPMLVKARRSRDLVSYSLGNIALANLGNVVHSVYVFSLPAGPIWLLHGFYLVSSGLMLGWYLRFALGRSALGRSALRRSPQRRPDGMGRSPDAARAGAFLASAASEPGGEP